MTEALGTLRREEATADSCSCDDGKKTANPHDQRNVELKFFEENEMQSVLRSGLLLAMVVCPLVAKAEEKSVRELIAALESDRPAERLASIDQLGLMGSEAAAAVPALTNVLKDPSAVVRAHAANSLGRMGSAARSAVPALMSLVGDEDGAVRREAIEALAAIRPGPKVTVPLLVKMLNDSAPEVAIRAASALADRGKEAVPFLLEALQDGQAAYWACLVISEMGPEAAETVPALMKLLDGADHQLRREAILALAEIGPAAAPAVSALARALDDEIHAAAATYALGRIGGISRPLERRIKENTEAGDPLLRIISVWTLARTHRDDETRMRKAVACLAEGLKCEHRLAREAAARALVDLDPDPEIVRAALKKALEGAKPEVLDTAMDAMAAMRLKVLPRLIEALEVQEVRARAAAIIARIGPEAKAAVPALIDALDDPDAATRSEVLLALAAMGPDARPAASVVIKCLNDPDLKVRYAACYCLGRLGTEAEVAKEMLQRHLKSPDRFLALASAWALACIDPQCAETAARSVAVLINGLKEREASTRVHAAEALGALGALAKDAVPALRQALKDPSPEVRRAAGQALRAIGE